MYFVVFFISPLYFLIRQKWIGFIVNLALYILSIATIWMFGLGIIFWAIAVGHAGWHLRREMMNEQAVMIAEQMAKKMHSGS